MSLTHEDAPSIFVQGEHYLNRFQAEAIGLESLQALGVSCKGYANGCACLGCTDRSARHALLAAAGHPLAAAEAKRVSDDYLAKPWRYRRDPDKPDEPPAPLRPDAA